jgi:hypothetical protein
MFRPSISRSIGQYEPATVFRSRVRSRSGVVPNGARAAVGRGEAQSDVRGSAAWALGPRQSDEVLLSDDRTAAERNMTGYDATTITMKR